MLLSVSTVSWGSGGWSGPLQEKVCRLPRGGEGKLTIKAPAIKGTTLEESQLTQHITKGEAGSKAPHNWGISGLTEEQATAIAEYLKTLK
jgi:hypothetical protein